MSRICCGKEMDIDILPSQVSLSNYCATLAHKVNSADYFYYCYINFNLRRVTPSTTMLTLSLCGIPGLVRSCLWWLTLTLLQERKYWQTIITVWQSKEQEDTVDQ